MSKAVQRQLRRALTPYSGTYTFVFSNQTANEEESNSGSADFYDEAGKMLKIATNGGNTYSANFHSKYRASKNLTKGAYLAKRSCKLDVVKSKTIYIYLTFEYEGTVDLSISGKKKNLPMSISKKTLSLKEGKTFKLSVKNAPGNVKWSSSDNSIAKVYTSGKVKAFGAGSAVITAKVGKKKLTCKVTVKGTKKNTETNDGSGNNSGGSTSSDDSGDDSSDSGSSGASMVWIPRTGSKYHSYSGCSGMRNPSYVSISDAIAWGYTACSKCW